MLNDFITRKEHAEDEADVLKYISATKMELRRDIKNLEMKTLHRFDDMGDRLLTLENGQTALKNGQTGLEKGQESLHGAVQVMGTRLQKLESGQESLHNTVRLILKKL